MTNLAYDSIDEVEAAWVGTPEVRPGAVSDGDHVFRIDAYRVETSKDGNPMIYAEITVVGGSDNDQMIKRYNSLKNPNMVGRYKAELKDLGIDTDAANFSIKAFIDSGWMIGKHVVGNALNSKDDQGRNNCNIRLLRFATEADMAGVATQADSAAAPAPAAPTAQAAPTQPAPTQAQPPAGVPAAPAGAPAWPTPK